jgi:hypothetical protein
MVRPLRVFHDDLHRAVQRAEAGDLVTFVGSGVGYNQAGAAFIMP